MHRSKRLNGDLIMMRDYEPSDAATWRMRRAQLAWPLPYLSDACS